MSTPPPSKRARREIGLMRPDGASFIGSASGIHFVQTVYSAISRAGLPNHIVPGEDDQLPQGSAESSLWRSHELSSSRNDAIELDQLLYWSQSYFDNWHPAFPFLHAPTIVQWLSDICSTPLTGIKSAIGPVQLAALRSIMSISLADSRQSDQDVKIPSALVFHSYDQAIESIQPVLIDRPSIESLQAVMGVQMFLISMLRLNAASRVHGIIIRLVLQMGLHRCPSRYPNFNPAEIEIRRRMFWSAYTIDRYLSQCLGLPITLRDDDTDVCFPDDEKHGVADRMDERLAFSCFIAKHARLKGQVIELCNKSINHRRFDTGPFQSLSITVAKWTNELEEYIEFSAAQSSPLSGIQQSILKTLKEEVVLSLNRPLLTAPKASPEYQAAMQSCTKAARSLILDLSRAIDTTQVAFKSGHEFERREDGFMFWPFLTWSVWISAFFILFAAKEAELRRHTAISLSEQVNNILTYLSMRGNIWPNACQAAVRDLYARLCDQSHQRPPANYTAESSAMIQSAEGKLSDDVILSSETRAANLPNLDFDSMSASVSGFDEIDLSLFEGFDIPFWLEIDEMIDTDLR